MIARFVYAGLFMLLAYGVSAQVLEVKGTVTDELGDGLPGATILNVDTEQGGVTDVNGVFSITVNAGQKIAISFVGYATQEFVIQGDTTLDVSLEPEVDYLDELVVVGYGTQKKTDITGSTGVVSSRDADLQPIQRVENMLQGRVAGVVVSQVSGAPGATPQVNIRGFTGNPTYVIDGLIDANINAINPNDIESISILKDASATAIYGSRGSNGVILITTKKADRGSPLKINGDYFHSISQLNKKLDLLDPLPYMQIVNQKLNEAGASDIFSRDEIDEARNNPNFGTDWQDEIFQTAHTNNFDLNLSKGWDKVALRASLGVRDDQGIVKNSSYTRYTSRINLEIKPLENTTISTIVGYTLEELQNINRGSANNAVVAAATAWSPNLSVIDPATGDYTGFQGYGATVRRNPVYLANEVNGISNNDILNAQVTVRQKFLNDFTASASYALQRATGDSETFRRYLPATQGAVSSLSSSNSENTRHQYNLQVDYSKQLNHNHKLDASLVAEVLDREAETFRYDNIYEEDGTPGETIPDPNDPFDFTELGQISYLARVNHSFKDLLLFTGSVRFDASSRLPESNQWDDFFSGAIAYRISQEPFLSSVGAIDDLKLRVGYGEVGNVNSIRHTQVQNLTNPDMGGFVFDGIDLSYAEGFEDGTNRANPNLSWEVSRTWNGGFDLVLWDGKLELNTDYYMKFTEDSHFGQPVPSFLGGGSIQTNSGRFLNKGVELTLIHQWKSSSDWSIRTSVNTSFNRSEVLEIPEDSVFRGNRESGFDQQSHILILGDQLGNLWGYEYLGPKLDGASSIPGEIPSVQDGDAIYNDRNGDGQITIDDMTVIGNGHPTFTWGVNSFIAYKDFTLNLFVQAVHGVDVYNLPQHGLLGGGAGVLDATSVEILDSYSFGGTLPALNANFRAQSSLFVEDASFIRFRNLAFGWEVPEAKLQKLGLSRVRLYASVQNLLTITEYQGYDPETKSGSAQAPGVDRGSFPVPRTYTIGINLSY